MIYELGDRKPAFKGDYFVAPNAAVIGRSRRSPREVSFPSAKRSLRLAKNVACSDAGSFVLRLKGPIAIVRTNGSIPDSSLIVSSNGPGGTLRALDRAVSHLPRPKSATVLKAPTIRIATAGDRRRLSQNAA